MQNILEDKWDLWEVGNFTGDDAPVTRATISKQVLKTIGQLDQETQEGDQFRTLLFAQTAEYIEIPNIVSCTIDRRLGADAASMTLVMRNQTAADVLDNLDEIHAGSDPTEEAVAGSALAVAPTKRELGEFAAPGFFTFQRGLTFDSQWKWGHGQNPTWVDMFIPNRVIRTFQGYGSDGSGQVHNDAKLDLTGTWLIDRVQYSAKGLVTIQCRDFAKLLIEQRLYPPIIPLNRYPLNICGPDTELQSRDIDTITEGDIVSDDLGRHQTVGWDSGNVPYFGINGSVYGHRPSHAFDGDESTYWLSMRNNGPNKVWSFEWIESDTRGELINQVHMKLKYGGYKIWVAVKVDGKWVDGPYVPYGFNSEPAAPNGSYVPYVKFVQAPSGDGWFTIDLDRDYEAEAVRVVFSNLANYGVISGGDFRAAVYELEVRYKTTGPVTTTETIEEEVEVPGNITDYTDIIKLFCAWSGFYWPDGEDDKLLKEWGAPGGRVWGDFFYSGAVPVEPACIPPSYWDNKSAMDGINQIKEILGFVFYIDVSGGVIFRPPNIWRTGNFLFGVGYVGEDTVRDVDETRVLLDYGVTIDDKDLRSKIVVVSAQDPTLHGAYTPGFSSTEAVPSVIDDLALLGGQERVMLVPNFPFISQAEVDKFGFLVSLWMHWNYRSSKFRIPGIAALEPDDQVRIYERVTAESFIHYVEGYSSVMNMDQGTWYMDVDTHWLGNGPSEEWHINMTTMDPSLYAYLTAIGQIDPDITDRPPEVEEILNWQPPTVPTDPIRIPDNYWEIFPDPVIIVYPDPPTDPEDGSASNDFITPPGPGSGGTAFACGNAAQFAQWGSGPFSRQPPSSGWKCNSSNIQKVTLAVAFDPGLSALVNTFPGQTKTVSVNIDRRAKGAFLKLADLFMDEGLDINHLSGYYCRPVVTFINGVRTYSRTSWSNHAWGLAVDFNAPQFPYGRHASAAGSDGQKLIAVGVKAENNIRTGNGKRVFKWGERFSRPDPMHFQVCAHPADLATGIVLR